MLVPFQSPTEISRRTLPLSLGALSLGFQPVRIFKQNQPFDVKKWPGYYGWVILIFGTLGMIAAVPGSPPGMSVFVDEMIEALDMNRSDFALAYTLGTIFAGLLAPFAGGIVDRLGARLTACASFLGLGVLLIYTGLVAYIYRSLEGALGQAWLSFTLVFVAFAGMRLAGVSFAMTACRSMIFRWFEGRRGWAAAINGVVLSLSFSSAPVLLNGVVVSIGWQQAWIAMGIVFIVGLAAVAFVFFRDSPEACGVEVERGGKTDDFKTRVPVLREFTGAEAVRTPVFWIFTAGLAVNALIGTGVAFHIIAIGEASGVSRADAVRIFLPVAMFHIATTLFLGAVTERIRLKYALILMIIAQTVLLYGVANLGDPFWRWVYIMSTGVAWGTFGILINVPWARFFGRKHLGSINGWVMGATVVTSALGPYLFGLSNELTGSFVPAILVCLAFCPVVIFFAAMADNPQIALAERTLDTAKQA